MLVPEIELLPEVQQAAEVLGALEARGLREAGIGGGWTRSMLIDAEPTDIDVAYVGDVHYKEASDHLRDVLSELGVDPSAWDVEGIWNATAAYGFTRIVDNYLYYYVTSIDSVYLAADGRLHDPTGFGFQDAVGKVLRLNEYDSVSDCSPTAYQSVLFCLEGCRRITQLGWRPTRGSQQKITNGVAAWDELTDLDKEYFIGKMARKLKPADRAAAQEVYGQFGWGFILEFLD